MKKNINKFTKLVFTTAFFAIIAQSASQAYNTDAINTYNKGIELTSKEKYEEAINYFKKSIEKDPSFVDAYYNLGVLQEFRGDNKKAAETFKKVLKYNPKDYEVIYKLATLHYIMENLEKAEEFMEQIPPEDPNYNRLVEFMADPEKNIHDVNRQSDKNKKNEKDDENDDFTDKLKGPDACEPLEKTTSNLNGPTGMAKDTEGNLYIANFIEDSIVFINNRGEEKVIARKGLIKGPIGLAIDRYNNLYVANYDSDEIVLLPASGEKPHILPIKVKKPYFLMIDESGILYVSEQGDNAVSKYKLIWKN